VFDAAAATATEFGLKLRVGNGQETLVGYDASTGEAFVDRSTSGFLPSEAFAARHGAPLEVMEDGTVKLHIFLDAASVELFANDGLRTITDQIFPDMDSLGVQLYAEGGEVELLDLDMWHLAPNDGVAKPPQRYQGSDAADLLVAQTGGKGTPAFFGFGGDDWVQGSDLGDLIRGGSGSDALWGGGGNDRIWGGTGDDRLSGGAGAFDELWGGGGSDVFVWRAETRDGAVETTTVMDFRPRQDLLDLGEAAIARIDAGNGDTVLTLDGDGDRIVLQGVHTWSDAWVA
jgi:hypothetical protein